MVIACDGIYDVLSNEEIVEFLNDRFSREEDDNNISNGLVDLCLYKVIISFSSQSWSPIFLQVIF